MRTVPLVLALVLVLIACSCASGGSAGRDAGGGDGDSDADTDADLEDGAPPPPDGGSPDRPPIVTDKPIVILMIGDGMGHAQLDAASLFAHGETGQLFMQTLPVQGEIVTGSLSGITDSAASATTMATGARTWNGSIGLDRDGQPAETAVELAHRLGMAGGVVTTALLPHATPGGFSAHRNSRNDYLDIADDQARVVRPEVLLGGGSGYYDQPGASSNRALGDLTGELFAAGWPVVRTSAELAAVDRAGGKVLGMFAKEHMTYVRDRAEGSTEPTLAEMSLAALDLLDQDPDGFFVMIEGARIDMAGHSNDLDRNVQETLAFDEAIEAVAGWIAERPRATLLVTADHECGGLRIVTPHAAGTLPDVEWRWGQHTNARVAVLGSGPGAAPFQGTVTDHRAIHAAIVAGLTEEAFVEPPRDLVADGHLADLRYRAVEQTNPTGFGAGYNQLDALWVDADDRALEIGVEGLFEWDHNALVVLVDTDLGAGTGPARLAGALRDQRGVADSILSALDLDDPAVDGFGADFALVALGGTDPRAEDMLDRAGLRGLHAPVGDEGDLWWYGAATNFGEGVRTRGDPDDPVAAVSGEGWETRIDWRTLFPDLDGGVPDGATFGIAAILVNDDGGYTSNQALPPFPDGTDNPGRTRIALPGLVRFVVDSDLDGVADAALEPTVVP